MFNVPWGKTPRSIYSIEGKWETGRGDPLNDIYIAGYDGILFTRMQAVWKNKTPPK